MPTLDLGVQADYVDRAFRKDDDKLAATPNRKRLDYGGTTSILNRDLEALRLVQASRVARPGLASLPTWLKLYRGR